MRLRPSAQVLLLATLAAGGAACAAGSPGTGDGVPGPAVVDCDEVEAAFTVALVLPAFAPATLTVPPGTAVRFTNDEVIDHAVSSGAVSGSWPMPDGALTAELAPGASVCARFDEAGDHPLFDALYPLDMTAVIVVH